jgi:hypothetical protein
VIHDTKARYGAALYGEAVYADLAELEWLTLRQAQTVTGKSARRLRHLIHEGVLPAMGSKGNRRVSRKTLLELYPPEK